MIEIISLLFGVRKLGFVSLRYIELRYVRWAREKGIIFASFITINQKVNLFILIKLYLMESVSDKMQLNGVAFGSNQVCLRFEARAFSELYN